jgi:hypothetical protein
MSDKTTANRRREPRYAVKDEVFLVFRPYFDRLGKLKDVSSGGVAFEYPVFAEYSKVNEVEVDIFASEPAHIMLRNLPCRVVYDTRIDQPTVSGVETRRCGLKFEGLSLQHAEQLKLLLNHCALHPFSVGQ